MGEHELRPESLPQRMLRDERFELGDQVVVAAQGQLRLQAALERLQAEGLEAGDLTLREQIVGQLGERGPTPQRERRTQLRTGGGIVTPSQRPSSGPGHPLKPAGIQGLIVQVEPVSARLGDQAYVGPGAA
jgi:hypothetical protein